MVVDPIMGCEKVVMQLFQNWKPPQKMRKWQNMGINEINANKRYKVIY